MKATVLLVGALALFIGASSVRAQYSEDVARQYVYMAAASYCSESQIDSWDCPACTHNPSFQVTQYCYGPTHNVQAFVGTMNGEAWVSFRGTVPSSLKDWIDDLKYFKAQECPTCCPGCKVHEGFFDSYKEIQDCIRGATAQIPGPLKITGHSLGAAMAALCAIDHAQDGRPPTGIYTFGQPRVGDSTFATYYKGMVPNEYRLVHYEDIVPHLPLEVMGFHHVATEVWYNEAQTSYTVCDGSGEDPNCSDSLWVAVSISDHLDYLNIHISDLCG